MCKGNHDCNCPVATSSLSVQLKADEFRVVEHAGRETMIVPLIMAKGNVVMNNGLLPADQFVPESWNGRPVTIGHPRDDDGHISASASPTVMLQWSIGTLYNASVDDEGNLRAEAYIDVAQANTLKPGLVLRLQSGENMQVSTGFFSERIKRKGKQGDKEYEIVHTHIRPDHLALLPDEVGACSWDDGCGVRVNHAETKDMGKRWRQMLASMKSAMAGLVDVSAFESLEQALAEDALKRSALETHTADTPDLSATRGGLAAMKKVDAAELKKLGYDDATVNAMVAAAEAAAKPAVNTAPAVDAAALSALVKGAVSEALATHGLSADDKAALAFARTTIEAHRAALVEKIVSNSDMKKEAIEKLPTDTLEMIANGLKVVSAPANYGGRALPTTNADGKDEEAAGMTHDNVVEVFAKAGQKKEAA